MTEARLKEVDQKELPIKRKAGRPKGTLRPRDKNPIRDFEIFVKGLEGMDILQLKEQLAGPLVSVVLNAMADQYMSSTKRAEIAIRLFDSLHKFGAPMAPEDKVDYMSLIIDRE